MPMGTLLLYLLLHTINVVWFSVLIILCFESQSRTLTHNSALIHLQPSCIIEQQNYTSTHAQSHFEDTP